MDKKQRNKKLRNPCAIFLLAGFGKRISNITKNPKSLLKINNQTLIYRNLEILKKLKINNIVLVLGYKKKLIKKEIQKLSGYFNFKYAYNNDYRAKGNSYSFLKGLEKSDGNSIIFDGDLIFSSKVLKSFLNNNSASSFLIGKTSMTNVECAKALADKRGFVRKTIDKRLIKKTELKKLKFIGEAIGIIQIKNDIKTKMILSLRKFLKKKENIQLNWEHFMNEFLKVNDVKYKKTINSQWIEIDTKEDYIKAKSLFKKND